MYELPHQKKHCNKVIINNNISVFVCLFDISDRIFLNVRSTFISWTAANFFDKYTAIK